MLRHSFLLLCEIVVCREAQEALRNSTRTRAVVKSSATVQPPRFALFGNMRSSCSMHAWYRTVVNAKFSGLCLACARSYGVRERPTQGAFPLCTRHPACFRNSQLFGRCFLRSSFLVSSHVLLYEASELPAVEPQAPPTMLIIKPRAEGVAKFKLSRPTPRTAGAPPSGMLSKRLTKSLTDGQASFFGGVGCVAALTFAACCCLHALARVLYSVYQACPPSASLLARMHERRNPLVSAAAPASAAVATTASALVLQVLEVMKAKKGVCTTPEIFSKCSSLGLLDTQKQLIEFREALQAVANCTDSVWTLKPEWSSFKIPAKSASHKTRK